MTGGWAASNTLREALHDGLEYFGHELDDVTGAVHAISPQAKKYDAGLAALALVETALAEAERCVKLHTYGSNGQVDPLHRDLAAALRAVREGK